MIKLSNGQKVQKKEKTRRAGYELDIKNREDSVDAKSKTWRWYVQKLMEG